MQAGTTYKLDLVPQRHQCIRTRSFPRHVQLRGGRSGAAARVRRIRDVHAWPEAGRPLQHLRAIPRYPVGTQRYHLQVARAGPDDIGPGVPLANQQTLRGTLNASRINVVNFFHFDVALSSDVTLRLRSRGSSTWSCSWRPAAASMRVLRIRTGVPWTRSSTRPVLCRRAVSDGQRGPVPHLAPHSRDHEHADTRRRKQRGHDPSGPDSERRRPCDTRCRGHVSIYIERFLPLDGWVFSRRVNLLTGSDGVSRLSFRPPTIGRWRFRSFFRGTETASPSSSGYLVVTVRS